MDLLSGTLLIFGIFVGYDAQPAGNFNFVCRDEEEFNICKSPCEQTCENVRRRTGIINCSRPCVSGCFCRDGFVRADDYTCVQQQDCFRRACGENEEYLECGSPCTSNCTNLNEAIFCTKPCQRGCFCKHDFVRDSNGKCIHRRNCIAGNQQCPRNEEYVTCVNMCNTCLQNSDCRTTYCTSGCDCRSGYYRNTYGECVTAEDCYYTQYDTPQQCGFHEIYTSCVNECNDCNSRGRCDYEQFYCSPGCDCRQGYFRNERGVCVPEWNCFGQGRCPPDEQYYDCIPRCRNTCETYNDPNLLCDFTCVKGCFCRAGYVRRQDGECVFPRDCPARPFQCPPGEVYYPCQPTCRTTCRSLSNFSGVCSTDCTPGCFCQSGFVRNDAGRCIRFQDCPVQTIPSSGDFEGRRGETSDKPNNETTTTLLPTTENEDKKQNETTTTLLPTTENEDEKQNETTTTAIPTTVKDDQKNETTTTIQITAADDPKQESLSTPTPSDKNETENSSSKASVSDTTTAMQTTTVSKPKVESSSPPSSKSENSSPPSSKTENSSPPSSKSESSSPPSSKSESSSPPSSKTQSSSPPSSKTQSSSPLPVTEISNPLSIAESSSPPPTDKAILTTFTVT